MSKKPEKLSFYTSVKNHKHLKAINKDFGFSVGDTIHRMIDFFAKDGNTKNTIDKLLK
jgi:hypothetical protein